MNNKKLLKGQADLMKAAAANRKATQEAHDKILAAKKVFVPEENPAFQQKPSDGKDIWADMYTKYEEPPKSELPGSSVRLVSFGDGSTRLWVGVSTSFAPTMAVLGKLLMTFRIRVLKA